MSNVLTIRNLEVFLAYLNTILKVVPSCQFNITQEGTTVTAITEAKDIKMVLTTNSMICQQDVEFCFKDVSKLYKSLLLINNGKKDTSKNSEQPVSIDLSFDGSFLSFKNGYSFKYGVTKQDVIRKYMTQNLSSSLNTICKITVDNYQMKKALTYLSIVTGEKLAAYISQRNNEVICEIGNKEEVYGDTMGITISNIVEGTLPDIMAISYNVFKLFFILNSKTVITLSELVATGMPSGNAPRIVAVYSKLESGEANIHMRMYCSLLKK